MQDVTQTPEWKTLTAWAADNKKQAKEDTLIIGDTVITSDGKTRPINPKPAARKRAKKQ